MARRWTHAISFRIPRVETRPIPHRFAASHSLLFPAKP
jgi:hypothetical protein